MLLDINSAFYSWIRGGMLVLFIYHVIIYFQNKDRIHKNYSIYLFCLTVYLIRDAFTNPLVQHYYQYISFSIQYIGYAYFIYFSSSLLNCELHFPKLDHRVKQLSKLLIAFALTLVVVQFFWGYEAQKKVVGYSVPFSSFCAFYAFYVLSRRRTKQVFYLLSGSIIFLVLANISSVKMIKGDYYLIDWKVHRMFYYFIGTIIQSIIFAILTGNYFREISEKKRAMEVSLLKQANQISELKITALKSQMNPHFLFNSLNSINNFVIQNKIDEASNFITKFSVLIRKVLQTTDRSSITLREELKILSVYIHLEQMRLKDSFCFEKRIAEDVNPDELLVVPLFLQPFFENAIWHGLSLKRGRKNLVLNISKEEDRIKVVIEDNGIGILASKKMKESSAIKKKSYGIRIVSERLKNMFPEQETSIQIQDISNEEDTGTMVSIVFPLQLVNTKY